MNDKQYRLCYVSGNVMYFTDNFKNQWGDDWDDAPYEHNAGEPYEYIDGRSAEDNKYRGHICYIAYMPIEYGIEVADSVYDISVETINKLKVVPWLACYANNDGLYAGATMEQAIEWLKKCGAKWGELHE